MARSRGRRITEGAGAKRTAASPPPGRRLHAVTGTPPASPKPAEVTPEQPKGRPRSVSTAASEGTPRELLVALQERVARAVDDPNTPGRDLAALTRRLMEITREIKALDAQQEQDEASEHVADEPFDASAI